MNESALSDEFLALISPCQSRLFGYLYSMLHNLDDTEDVLQQAVLAMWRRFDQYDRDRSFVPWAMQFAKRIERPLLGEGFGVGFQVVLGGV